MESMLAEKKLSEDRLLKLIDKNRLPRHVAIIMDGNGRWAETRGLPRIAGHREGIRSVREIVTLARELEIQALTIYAFSLENWQRPQKEIDFLMVLLEKYIKEELHTIVKNGIKFRTIGRVERLPESVVRQLEDAEARTSKNNKMVLTAALSYGGRAEIVDAISRMLEDSQSGKLDAEKVDETCVSRYLSTEGLPDPDLMIRTSGETRISNFLLWQMAYTELYFTAILWPDFRRREFLEALFEYQRRDRRFGLVKDQPVENRRVGRG